MVSFAANKPLITTPSRYGAHRSLFCIVPLDVIDEWFELVQVAAVAVAMVECFDRSRGKGGL